MSEQEKELKFVRLRSIGDDLVGYVTYKQDCLLIEQPLRVEIETYFEEGRQILSMQEYLPQSIIELKEIEISYDDVLFSTPVRKDFIEQYESVSAFFYDNKTKIKANLPTKEKEATDKVISLLEALQSKKDKPIH